MPCTLQVRHMGWADLRYPICDSFVEMHCSAFLSLDIASALAAHDSRAC